MIDNPVVEEVRQARKEILEHYHGDVRAMLRGMIQKQRESGLAIVKDVPKTSRPLARIVHRTSPLFSLREARVDF